MDESLRPGLTEQLLDDFAERLAAKLAPLLVANLGSSAQREDGVDRFLTKLQAASVARCSRKTIQRWIDAGQVEAAKRGGKWLIQRNSLMSFLAETQGSPGDAPNRVDPEVVRIMDRERRRRG